MSKTNKIEIPETAKVFEFKPIVEICGECQGTGIKFDDTDITKTDLCKVCNGSGRVVKEKTVIIDIKPYL